MTRNRLLWTVQALLALLFLFAGTMKLIMPLDQMAGPVDLPGPFLRFLGVAEVLGAIGLIAPWLSGIRPTLTPLAAACLIVIMAGATVITAIGSVAGAVVPLTVGLLLAGVVYGRTRPQLAQS